jgi:hypothetical protein
MVILNGHLEILLRHQSPSKKLGIARPAFGLDHSCANFGQL